MLSGFLDLPILGLIVITLVMTHITIASVTIFLHRHQAHKAVELHPLMSHFFRCWLWLTTGMVTKEWVAVHRKHHAKCETKDDPHSPQISGIRKVLFQGAELYRDETAKAETLEKFGRDTPNDWLERSLYSRFPQLGVALMLVIDCALFGVYGITMWAVQMVWIPWWAAGVINGVGHYFGYRNFETQDASTNLSSFGMLIGGEELHNNHHAYPSSARFSNKWWEFDIGWCYIRLMQTLGLAQVKKVSPKATMDPGKSVLDLDTLSAVVKNRYHILTLYGRHVIKPVVRDERRSSDFTASCLFKKAKKLMVREGLKLDKLGEQTLTQAFDLSQRLETVYQFKQQLKDLWNQKSMTQEIRFERLRDWCARAERSGIQALEEFALLLRGYSLQAP